MFERNKIDGNQLVIKLCPVKHRCVGAVQKQSNSKLPTKV